MRRSNQLPQTALPRWKSKVISCALVIVAAAPKPVGAGAGDYDARFADNGRFEVSRSAPPLVVQQPDGGLLLIGHPPDDMGDWYHEILELARYFANGRPDPSYGQSGRIAVSTQGEQWLWDAALQPDGKVVVAGAAADGAGLRVRYLARIDPAGALDGSFGIAGRVLGDAMSSNQPGYKRVMVMPGGDVVALMEDVRGATGNATNNLVDRFDRDGRPVSSRMLDAVPVAMATLGDNIIVATRSSTGVRLLHLRRNGSADPDFGSEGAIELPSWADAQVASSSAGERLYACGGGEVRRFDADGRPSAAFGRNGSGTVALEALVGARLNQCEGIMARADGGAYVVASDVQGTARVSHRTFMVSLRPDGDLDTTFGSGQGFTQLRGVSAPLERWQGRGIVIARDGGARVLWRFDRLYSEGFRVDALDLGKTAGDSVIGFAPGAVRVLERKPVLEVSVVRNGPAVGPVSARYESVPGTADVADFGPFTGTVQWADGDSSPRVLRLPVVDDSLIEGEENLELRLVDVTGAATAAGPAVVTIVDDDVLASLRFRDSWITWTVGPGIPTSAWPALTLLRDDAGAGQVTAYSYMSNGIDSCCAQAVTWLGGDVYPKTVFLQPDAANLGLFWVSIVDEEWNDAGPSARVSVLEDSTPPGSGGGGPGGNPGGEGGGGVSGLFEVASLALLALLQVRFRRRGEAGVQPMPIR